MARIRWVEEREATGETASAYHDWMAANPGRPGVPSILKCLSLRPDLFRAAGRPVRPRPLLRRDTSRAASRR